MEQYSDRRSKTDIAFLRRGSRTSSRNQSPQPQERIYHNSYGPGRSTRLDPMKTRMANNQERPRYVCDLSKSSSSNVVPASSSKIPIRKFEEKRRQPLLAGVSLVEINRRKVEAKDCKKINLEDANADTSPTEPEGFTTKPSHFSGPSGVSACTVGSLVQSASQNSRTHRQQVEEMNMGLPNARSLSLTNRSTISGNSTIGVRPSYSHSGVQRRGLKNISCTSVPDVHPSGCTSDSIHSRRLEVMRKRTSDGESTSRTRSLSGPSSIGHSAPIFLHDTGPRNRMSEQSLSQQIIRSSSRNHQDSAVSVRTRRSSPQGTRLRLSGERVEGMLSLHDSSTVNGQSDQERFSLEEISAENSIRPFSVEFPHEIYSSSRQSSNTLTERRGPSSLFEDSPPQMFHGLLGERESRRHISVGGFAEVLVALERIQQAQTYEQLLLLETNIFLGAFASHDQHRGMRLDIDNMSYEELLALEERIGSVSTALSEEQFVKCLRRSIYSPVRSEVNKPVVDDMKCSICQEEYMEGDEVGRLPCEHQYHVCCIGQWFRQKNWCPVCKASAVLSTG